MIKKLLLELLSIESFSGNEKSIADFLEKQLVGFKIERQKLSQGRYNLIARKGSGGIWIVVHMDTVQGWIEPRIEGDKIFGRGAVDNKGNIATALTVAKELENINLCFTASEETDLAGAHEAHKIVGKDLAIVMEPTSFDIYSAQRGILSFTIETQGRQGHSAYLKPGDNALLKVIGIINKLETGKWTAFNVGKIEGGTASNVVPGSAKAFLSIRPDNIAEYKKALKAISKFKIETAIEPYKNPTIKGKTKKTFTEMAFFQNAFVWGVGDSGQGHTANEHIMINELEVAPAKLKALIKKLGK